MKLQLWDTAGEERYKSLTSIYYRNADAVLIVFDLSRGETFRSVPDWIENVKAQCGSDILITLVGNKCDLESEIPFHDIEVTYYIGF